MSDSLYERLSVNRDASPEDIQKAYRKKAAKAHPDAGGDYDEGEFFALVEARDVLLNQEKRSAYDATGFIPGRDKLEMEALGFLTSIAIQILTNDPTAHVPMGIRNVIAQQRAEAAKAKETALRAIDKINEKWTGAEVLKNQVLVNLNARALQTEANLKVLKAAEEMLANIVFKEEARIGMYVSGWYVTGTPQF